jgi:hypothetical protein
MSMPDSDDAYLLEVMASHAALAFRPDLPKVSCRCKCEEKVDALIDAFNGLAFPENEAKPPQQGGMTLAFGAGVVTGTAIMLLGRRKR